MSGSLAARQERARLYWYGAGLLATLALLSYHYYHYNQQRKHKQQRIQQLQQARELIDFTPTFFSLFEQFSGGCMLNACVHATRRINNSNNKGDIIIMACGGWAALPNSVTPLPMPAAPPSTSSSTEELDLYWLTRCLGKSSIYNYSFAFFLSLLQRKQSNCLAHQQEPVLSINLSIGTFIPLSARPVIDVVCEIGTINSYKRAALADQGLLFAAPSDLHQTDLAEICDFGTTHILHYVDREKLMPSQDSAGLEDVIWQRAHYQHQIGKDVWITIETQAGRFHLDLSAAQYGHHHGYRREMETHTYTSTLHKAHSSNDDIRQQTRYVYDSYNTSYSIFDYAPPPASSVRRAHFSPTPLIAVLTDAELEAQGTVIDRSIHGADAVIKHIQQSLLLNQSLINADYWSLERIIRAACQMRGISTYLLYHPL